MNRFVLDTSIALAWYLPEEFSPEAHSWQNDFLDGRVQFVVPTLHYWEIGNVLRTYVRRRELKDSVAREIYALHLEAPLDVKDPNRETVLDTALEYNATVYDAVYIALSLSMNIPLLTAERTTTPWVVKLGALARTL